MKSRPGIVAFVLALMPWLGVGLEFSCAMLGFG
jgi:hypothetical protein